MGRCGHGGVLVSTSLVCSSSIHDAIRADAQAWADCELLGFNRWEAFEGEPAGQTEVRLCSNCGSSIGIVTLLPVTIVCDDGNAPTLYWCGNANGYDGQGWSDSDNEALRFATAHAADAELRAARGSFSDRRREYVSVEEMT